MSVAPHSSIDFYLTEAATNQQQQQQQNDTVAKQQQQNARPIIMAITDRAYRLHFSCGHAGKFIPSSKRQITWTFGFTNLESVQQGKSFRHLRGEENEVELLWSLSSGKVRVYWNKENITDRTRQDIRLDMTRVDWESPNGEKYEINAHVLPRASLPQYNLTVNGMSFFALPHLSELGETESTTQPNHEPLSDGSSNSLPPTEEIGSSQSLVDPEEPPEDMGFRLSMAGLASADNEEPFAGEDDLRTEQFSCTLEMLRYKITACIPGTEEIVSSAVINAFAEGTDHGSLARGDSSLSSCDSDLANALQTEVETLWETYEWLKLQCGQTSSPAFDWEEQKINFMAKHIDSIFILVQQERISPEDAEQILVEVAIALSMRLNVVLPSKTLILGELGDGIKIENLINALSVYGGLEAVSVAKGRRFGFCRYKAEHSASKAWEAYKKGSISVKGTTPVIRFLSDLSPNNYQRPSIVSRRSSDSILPLSKPSVVTRQRSHQRNTVSIDGTFILRSPDSIPPASSSSFDDDFISGFEVEPITITPDNDTNALKTHDFINIPAQSSYSPIAFEPSEWLAGHSTPHLLSQATHRITPSSAARGHRRHSYSNKKQLASTNSFDPAVAL